MDNWPTLVLQTLLELRDGPKGTAEGELIMFNGAETEGAGADGAETAAEKHEELETAVSVAFIVVLTMLLFYMSMGALIEKYSLSFGHEASFTVVFGKYRIHNSN